MPRTPVEKLLLKKPRAWPTTADGNGMLPAPLSVKATPYGAALPVTATPVEALQVWLPPLPMIRASPLAAAAGAAGASAASPAPPTPAAARVSSCRRFVGRAGASAVGRGGLSTAVRSAR